MVMQRQNIRRWQEGQWHDDIDTLSRETRVNVTYAGERFQLWASPHDEDELATLALGHVLLEGGGGRGVRRLGTESPSRSPLFGGGQKAMVRPVPAPNGEYAFAVSFGARPGHPDQPGQSGQFSLSGQAGDDDELRLAGGDDAPAETPAVLSARWERATPDRLIATMGEVMEQSSLWEATGCFHRCAVWDPAEGRVIYIAEDIGRHNCLDRVAGWAWQEERDLTRHALFLSARITASLYAKAQRTGSRCLVSASAVSSAAVLGARKDGITLVGFCRPQENRLSVYVNGLGLPNLESPR